MGMLDDERVKSLDRELHVLCRRMSKSLDSAPVGRELADAWEWVKMTLRMQEAELEGMKAMEALRKEKKSKKRVKGA